MGYCTAAEVRAAIDFPSTGAPISDTDITTFIGYAEEEIENIYKTKFGNVEATGTAESGDTTTITVASTPYTPNEFIGYIVWVHTGTNAGEYREITANTDNDITVSPAFTEAIDNTSQFRIVKLGYKDETVDGTGSDTMFVDYQPLINVNSLTINSTSVTPSNIYQYKDTGRLVLGDSAEAQTFLNSTPQLVNIKYIYGVYPIPQVIKRLCIVLAAIRTLISQIAGTYDDFTSISLPGGFTGAKGEPYMNIKSALDYLQGEARGIVYGTQNMGQVSGDFRTGASYRPFTLFA
jgi:hypothetical protein